MDANWDPTHRLVTDRRDALEAEARRRRLLADVRPARRFVLRRRTNAAHVVPVSTPLNHVVF